VIEMRVAGEVVILRSCSTCDLRWWGGIDGSLTLDDVLGLAARS
jgi:hypothetical protein